MNYFKPKTMTALHQWLRQYYPDISIHKYSSPQLWALYYRIIRDRESVTL